jgi:phospholipid/cholesterol/gamma-HCH transport system permease protein
VHTQVEGVAAPAGSGAGAGVAGQPEDQVKPTEQVGGRQPVPLFVVEIGAMSALLLRAIRRGLRPPFDIGAEFVSQLRFTIAVSWLSLVLMGFALSFGPAGIIGSDFLGLFGALDRLGGAYVLVNVREIAPLAAGLVLAGVAGTAICADIGARVVRGELDALEVMGIDTIKSIVAPRLFVLIAVALPFMVVALFAGMLGAVLVIVENHAPLGPFFSDFFANATTLEFVAACVKCVIFAAVVAIVCCYKGMNVSGGAEGVGRAVNQSVVICFLAIGAIDYVFTQALLATHPILSEVRG